MLNDFEKKVLKNLLELNAFSKAEISSLGVAVSGGADSISLLTAISQISLEFPLQIKVITVNHFIRPENETCGDVDFVKSYCEKLSRNGINLDFFVSELKKGEVFEVAKNRNCGIEESARFLRYQKFDEFIKKNNLKYLCLAHNQNDQIETLVMRFLQGSSANYGIRSQRKNYIRPLLNISRSEIESYLNEKNILWRTDSTNFDTNYLRNKIRLKVIPFFNEEFPGWQNAVLKGGEKQLEQNDFINQIIEKISINFVENSSQKCVKILSDDFFSFPKGFQIQILLKMCNLCGFENRIPFVFLSDVIKDFSQGKECKKYYDDLEISYKKNIIFVKKYVKNETDLCFFDIIKKSGSYEFPFGKIEFLPLEDSFYKIILNGIDVNAKVQLPVCVRNSKIGDVVLDSYKNYKKVSDVFSDWKVSETERCFIPIIQDLSKNQNILCILGCSKGFNNWIVKITS